MYATSAFTAEHQQAVCMRGERRMRSGEGGVVVSGYEINEMGIEKKSDGGVGGGLTRFK